jgi:replicative DNA helicase
MDNKEILEIAKEKVKLIDYIEGVKKNLGNNKCWVNPCPICNHKDHFTIDTNKNLYHSFSGCCEGGSIIDYMVNVENMTKSEAINKTLDLAGMSHNKEDKKMIKNVEKPIPQTVESYKRDIDLTNIIYKYYNKNNSNREYFISRGLTNEIIDKYKLCVVDPKELLKDNIDLLPKFNNIGVYEYILPIWENNKITSLIGRRNDNKSLENAKTFNLKGVELKIFNLDLLKSDKKIIFITEGIFDGLAIESMGNSYNSISLNSVNMVNRFIDVLKANLDTCKDKQFILCGDSGNAGNGMNMKLQKVLNELEIDNVIFDLNGYDDVNDFAVNDEGKFSLILSEMVNSFAYQDSAYEHLSNQFMKDIEKMRNYKLKSTGFMDLNEKLNGGLHSGLYVLGAISSLGKTTLIHQIADNVASQGNNVLFFSLEQSKTELLSKSISRELCKLNIDYALTARQIMNGENNSYIKSAVENYSEASKNVKIYEGNFNTTVKTIRSTVERHVKRFNDNPLVIVDYLQILQSVDVRMSDKQKVETNVTELKRISRDYNIPLIVISSLNRDSYLNPISFESFKETGGIEYTADLVLGLQYTNVDIITEEKSKIKQREMLKRESLELPRQITLVCLKQRNGQQNFSTGFKFYPHYNYFVEA